MPPVLYRILSVVFLCLFVATALSAQSNDEADIFALVNRERVKHRLQPLEWDDKIAELARNYSRRMAREGFFDHYDPNGKSVSDRARKVDWETIGENLFMGTERPQLNVFAVRGWMRSDSHRKNILNKVFTASGLGIARGKDGNIYVTQVFLSRSSSKSDRRY